MQLDALQTQALNAALSSVVERWIAEANSRGFDGQALVDAAQNAVRRYSP